MIPMLIAAAAQALPALANSPAASAPATSSGLGAFTPVFTVGPKIVGRDNSAPQTVSPTVTNTPALSTGSAPGLYTSGPLQAIPAGVMPASGGISMGMWIAIGAAALILAVAVLMPKSRKKD